MFGCCVAGRLLQTDLQQVDETHAVFHLPRAGSINHVCVFLLGTVPFPVGFGATVHLYWPGKGFQLLGMISNDKPSAIFRLRGTFTSSASTNTHNAFSSVSSSPSMDGISSESESEDITAILGISVEPLSQIESQITTVQSSPSSLSSSTPNTLSLSLPLSRTQDPTALASKIVKHLFNYVSGFVEGGGMPQTQGGVRQESVVPMSLIVRWYESFMGKVRAGGVGFLERVE